MRSLTTLIISFLACISYGQNLSGIINQYYAVTSVNMTEFSVDVSNSAGINSQDSLILIQMQGADISNSSIDTINGSITNYNGTGSWEKVHVCEVNGNTIIFKKTFKNNYNTNGKLQLIPISVYNNAIISDTVKCAPWNGSTGGVVIIFNTGNLTFQAPISVSGLGFRGGQHSLSTSTCSFAVNLTGFEYATSSGLGAMKGEGIALYNSNADGGRGPLGNGGGGGNDHNSGGGGGSNVSGGGIGGENDDPGIFTCKGYNPGIGGKSLSTNNERLFMGGGGGAGHSNSAWISSGANGGGIVIIVSDQVTGNGASILGYGLNAPEAHGDGAGGGGGGGSVCLLTDNLSGTLFIDLHGGNGGDMDASIAANTTRCFGPGGGGGGGSIRYKGALTLPGIFANLGPGSAGIVLNSSAGCNGSSVNASSGANGLEEFNGEVPTGIKCNMFCSLVPNVNLGGNVNTCDQDSVLLNAQSPGLDVLWSNGSSDQTIEVFGAGQYSVIVDNGFCLTCDTIEVSNFSNPDLPSELFFEICDGSTAVLDAENPGNSYQWNTGDTSQTISVTSDGIYDVLISNGNCSRGAFFDVFECFDLPNTITPNNDGFNDNWVIPGINNYQGNELIIFNRRGQEVFKAVNYQNNFNGFNLPAGVYYYSLDLKNQRDAILGTITLIR